MTSIFEDRPTKELFPEEKSNSAIDADWQKVPEVPPQTQEVVKLEKKSGLPVRCGDDRIWLLSKGKKHWITTPQVYSSLGFKFGDEKDIDAESLALFADGEPLT